MKQRKVWRMSCDLGKATEGLENELWCRWSDGKLGEWALLKHSKFFYRSFRTCIIILNMNFTMNEVFSILALMFNPKLLWPKCFIYREIQNCIFKVLGGPVMNNYGWLWWPNDFRGPWGLKASWHLSYRWGKTPKKPHLGNLYRPGIEPGPAASEVVNEIQT